MLLETWYFMLIFQYLGEQIHHVDLSRLCMAPGWPRRGRFSALQIAEQALVNELSNAG